MRISMEKRNLLAIACALLLAFLFRLYFFRGLFAVDDFNYARYAAELWKGRYELSEVLFWHGTRPLIFIPISFCFKLFGVSDATSTAWPLVASMITVAIIYFTARRLFGGEAALYAGLLAAMLPQLVDEASRITPGPIINLMVAASVFFFFHGQEAKGKGALWLFVSGFVFGTIPWAGRLGLIAGCFFPLAILFTRHVRMAGYWPLAAGVALAFALDTFYQWMETGDPLFSYSIAKKILSHEIAYPRPFFYAKLLISPLYRHGGVFFIAIAGAILALIERHRRALLIAAWMFFTWLIMEFGSSSITRYQPLFKEARFFSLLSVPGVLLAGFALTRIRSVVEVASVRSRTRLIASVGTAVVVLLVAASSCISLHKLGKWEVEQRSKIHKVADYVRAARGKTIYVTHWLWNTRVAYFLGFDDEYFSSGYDPYHAVLLERADPRSMNRYVQTIAPGEEMSPGILLHDEKLFLAERPQGRTGLQGKGEIPGFLAHPPEEWPLLDRIAVGTGGVVAIYEIRGGRWPQDPER